MDRACWGFLRGVEKPEGGFMCAVGVKEAGIWPVDLAVEDIATVGGENDGAEDLDPLENVGIVARGIPDGLGEDWGHGRGPSSMARISSRDSRTGKGGFPGTEMTEPVSRDSIQAM